MCAKMPDLKAYFSKFIGFLIMYMCVDVRVCGCGYGCVHMSAGAQGGQDWEGIIVASSIVMVDI